jgi:hypothetical protein
VFAVNDRIGIFLFVSTVLHACVIFDNNPRKSSGFYAIGLRIDNSKQA